MSPKIVASRFTLTSPELEELEAELPQPLEELEAELEAELESPGEAA